jgi:hypothetical protein
LETLTRRLEELLTPSGFRLEGAPVDGEAINIELTSTTPPASYPLCGQGHDPGPAALGSGPGAPG